MDGQRVQIIRKNDKCSMGYRIGDMSLVNSTWYGEIDMTSKSGIPLSLDKEEYEFVNGEDTRYVIDTCSYGLGVMDCFYEAVSTGLKTLAMGCPCGTREERDPYLADAGRLYRKYGVRLYPEDGIERLIERAGTENR